MASAHDKAQLAKAVIAYMGIISEQTFSRQDKKIARSSELRCFLSYLSKRAPSEMDRLLKVVSRECGQALRAEKESRTGKKRAEPPNRTENNAKRVKFTCAAEEGPIRQTAVDDEEHVPIKDETPKHECDSQSSETARPHTPTSEKNKESGEMANPHTSTSENNKESGEMTHPHTSNSENNKESEAEDAEKGASNTKPAQNEIRSGAVPSVNERQEGAIVPLPTAYEIESGLSSRLATIEKEMMPGEKLQARTNWKISDPSEILDTLDNVRRNTVDNKIHRAYGQTMLFSSVNAQVTKGYKSTVTGHRSDHTSLLEELARKKAGPVSQTEIDQIIASYFYEYYAGRNWLAVIDWFGGSGVVLVFVSAGIGSWYVEARWTEFQRSCVQHIAGLLGSIRGLVGTLGPDALGKYCQHGCLGSECLDRVKMASFSKPDKDEESEDEESEDEESGDEGSRDGGSGDEESGEEETADKEMGDEEMGDEEIGDEELGSEESGNEGPDALDSYDQPGCLSNDCTDRTKPDSFTKPGGDEGSGDEEPGNEESEDEESGDDGTEYEDEESENGHEESEGDTD